MSAVRPYSNIRRYKDKKYDDSRNKLNKILDFILYYNYIINESYVTDDLIEELRKVTSEEGKEKIYHNEAARLWKNIISEKLSEILTKIEKENIQELQNAIVDNIDIDSVKINPDNMTYFSKLIYLLTYFIDGKEINNLLTKLINKFENIGSFLNTAKQMKLKCKFNKNYSFFENSYQLSEEMRIINSFARMEKPSSNAKKYMYIDACYILGYEAASLDEYDKLFFKDENGNQRKQNDHDFRNFICNNVIENDRFKYLVKYANTKKVRLLAKNEKVIEFVLSQLPEEQLERYCNSCFNEIPLNKIQKLTKLIVQMDQQFERLKKVKQNNDKDNVEKKQCQSIISLYLFVMYLLVKKLVNINSRYVTAFYYVERDSLLYSIDIKYEKDGKNYKDYRKLTNYLRTDESESAKFFRKNGYFKNSKYYKMAEDNYNNSDEKMCTVFRNAIDHLNAVRNANEYIDDIKYIESYYSLYQYLIQRAVIKKYPEISYAKQLEKYKTYSKDFTKALCIPFAYNTPRFKDLTIDALFDKERQINKKAKL